MTITYSVLGEKCIEVFGDLELGGIRAISGVADAFEAKKSGRIYVYLDENATIDSIVQKLSLMNGLTKGEPHDLSLAS